MLWVIIFNLLKILESLGSHQKATMHALEITAFALKTPKKRTKSEILNLNRMNCSPNSTEALGNLLIYPNDSL